MAQFCRRFGWLCHHSCEVSFDASSDGIFGNEWRQSKRGSQYDVWIIGRFECRRTIGKREVLGRERDRFERLFVHGLCRDEDFGDFLSVSSDILDDGTAQCAGDSAHALDTATVFFACGGDDFVE